MRRFRLFRDVDVSGVSGTGYVAEGIEFKDGSVAVRWYGQWPSTSVWDSAEAMTAVHGHGGTTRIKWED